MMEQYLGEPEEMDTFTPPDPDYSSELTGNVVAFPGRTNSKNQAKNA